MPIYLGFDCSTQGLTAVAIEVEGGRRRIVYERALDYDRDLPAYRTANGVWRTDADPLAVVSPPLMWAEALDHLIALVAGEGGFDLARLAAVSGSAQQHGSVYLGAGAAATLASLDPARALAVQLEGLFTRTVSPIWMDSSTASQCAAITAAVGGPTSMARLTGSRAFERFTGPQVRKFFEQEPDGYARTGRIHLVSSFLASLLVVGQRNPMYSVLLLIASFMALAGLYVLLDAPFTAVTQIIIYAGAIMVLFLFVVMLLNVPREDADAAALLTRFSGARWFGALLSLALIVEFAWALWRVAITRFSPESAPALTSVRAIGQVLFTDYAFAFEVTSVLILVAMVGAVVLARREGP